MLSCEHLKRYLSLGCVLLVSACVSPSDSKSSHNDSPAAVFAVQGSLHAIAGAAVDGDVNDPQAKYTPNDAPTQAQTLTSPVSLGGYLNLPRRGASGDSYMVGDVVDVYQTTLRAGQTITLTLGDDHATNDLDLLLVNERMEVVNGSFGVGRTESLTITDADVAQTLYIAVMICGSTQYRCDPLPSNYVGASTYVLDITDAAGSAAVNDALRLSDDFVPGDVIARFNSTPDVSSAPRALAGALRSAPRRTGRSQLLRTDKPATGATISGLRTAQRGDVTLQTKLDTIMSVKALRRRGDSADLNYTRSALNVPNDPWFSYQWHYQIINLPQAWDVTTGAAQQSGAEVIVAVIDTGVLLDHPDLKSNVIPGFDFISDVTTARDGDGMDSNPNDPGDLAYSSRSSFHGTHVAGTIAANSNNGVGSAGVAWHAKIMPLRVLGQGGGTSYDVMQAVLYAAGLENDSGTLPTRRADVINLSLGGGGFSQAEQDAFTRARAAGVVIVAAAGNNNTSVTTYPAGYNGVVSVGAVDSKLGRAYYSNYGATVDIVAPGGSFQWDMDEDGQLDAVMSTLGSDSSGSTLYTYGQLVGTSMATPHVAGVVALMKALKPDLNPDEFDALLASGALTQDLGVEGRDDQFGYGLIDAFKAVVSAANGEIPSTPTLVAFPRAINFEKTLTRITLAVNNAGGGTLTAQAAIADAPWITLESQLDARGMGTYTVSVDRRSLENGNHSASITISSDANTLTIPVYMIVDDTNASTAALEYQWVVLIDAQSNATVAATQAALNLNGYEFSFDSIAPGDYYVLVGSDLDNDGYICDGGEACGAYAPQHDLAPINVVDADVTGINLNCGFNRGEMLATSTRFVVPANGVARSITQQ